MLSLSVSSNPSNSVPSSPSTTPGRGKKYYVVSVGKCTGVFNNWFTLYFFLSRLTHDSFLFDLNRPYVQSLTSGVTGGCQKSYPTYNEALSVYREIKGKGLVQIIRDPGDEIFFGSIEDAMQ
jgi:Caulimovirus viroplasmin